MTTYPQPLAGVVEAVLDEVEYIKTVGPVVVAVRGDQQLVYCLADDWAASPAAQHAARVEEIAQLEARLVSLKAAAAPLPLLAPAEPPAKKPKKVYNRTAPPAEPVPCPHCERTLKGRAALMLHVRKSHPGLGFDVSGVATVAPAEPPAEPEPAPVVVEASAPAEADPNPYMKCPHCITRVRASGLAKHIAKMHDDLAVVVAPAEPEPAPAPLACRYCGEAQASGKGRASHERACEKNPERRLMNRWPPQLCPRCGLPYGRNAWEQHTSACQGGPALAWPGNVAAAPAETPEPAAPPVEPAVVVAETPPAEPEPSIEPASPDEIRLAILGARHKHAAARIDTLPEDARPPWRTMLAQAEDARAALRAGLLNVARRHARRIADGAIRASLLAEAGDDVEQEARAA